MYQAYWKNGNLTVVGDTCIYAQTTAIAISGNDIYLSGVYAPITKNYVQYSGYWKNGNLVFKSPILTGHSR